MQLDCPFCGCRDAEEFTCLGTVPDVDTDPVSRLYLRIPRTDLSVEYWEHSHGCQSWLLLERNPSTNEVLSIEFLDSKPAGLKRR